LTAAATSPVPSVPAVAVLGVALLLVPVAGLVAAAVVAVAAAVGGAVGTTLSIVGAVVGLAASVAGALDGGATLVLVLDELLLHAAKRKTIARLSAGSFRIWHPFSN